MLTRPGRKPRDGWAQAIDKVIAAHGLPDEPPPLDIANEFDEAEWTCPMPARDRSR